MYFLKICDKLVKRYAIYLLKGVFTVILGSQLKNAIISGSNNISKYKKQINELNIFPVPDGDTGTNMSMTIGAAAEEMKKLEDSATAAQVAKKAASSMLRGPGATPASSCPCCSGASPRAWRKRRRSPPRTW